MRNRLFANVAHSATLSTVRFFRAPEQKSIAKPVKKGGYKNYCKKMREEWKKKGEKYTVPEQGKKL